MELSWGCSLTGTKTLPRPKWRTSGRSSHDPEKKKSTILRCDLQNDDSRSDFRPKWRIPRRSSPDLEKNISTTLRRSKYYDFIFPDDIGQLASHSSDSLQPSFQASSSIDGPLCGQLVVAAATFYASSALGHGGATGVAIACLPLITFNPFGDLDANSTGEGEDTSSQARLYRNCLTGSCFTQGAVAVLEFALNDPFQGLINCGVATLGMQAAAPQGQRFLSSYIVLGFCSGTMQFLVSVELLAKLPFAAMGGPSHIAQAVALGSPCLVFLGVFFAWQLYTELRTQGDLGSSARVAPEGPANPYGAFRPFAGESFRLADPGHRRNLHFQ